MKIIIMRGLPGSGKTYYTGTIDGKVKVVSADHYHIVNGEYKFDARNIAKSHQQCLRKYVKALMEYTGTYLTLIVDNTNCSLLELCPYVRLAQAHGIDFKIHCRWCTIEDSYNNNIHAVPLSTIIKMYNQLLSEIVPMDWNQEVVKHSTLRS